MKQADFLFIIAIIAVLVAFSNLIITLNTIKTLTGYATEEGSANLTIESSVDINFSVDSVNWGSGRITAGESSAILVSNGTVVNGNWTVVEDGLRLQNLGNQNVTINLTAHKTDAEFIGGTNPEYQWNISNYIADSCTEFDVPLGDYWDVNKTPAEPMVCDPLQFGSSNTVEIDIRLYIPLDSSQGALSDYITATAVVDS